MCRPVMSTSYPLAGIERSYESVPYQGQRRSCRGCTILLDHRCGDSLRHPLVCRTLPTDILRAWTAFVSLPLELDETSPSATDHPTLTPPLREVTPTKVGA